MSLPTLGLPLGQTHKPNPRFNLFHLDAHEIHLDSFKVQIFDPSQKSLQHGLLHVCSRSIVFDSAHMETDLLKLRYNASKFTFDTFGGDILLQSAASPLYGQILEVVQSQIPSSHLESYLQEVCILVLTLQGRQDVCARIPRERPGPATSYLGGTFIFMVLEDHLRQQHLSYTIQQFTQYLSQSEQSISIVLSEQEIVKRFCELQQKKYNDFILNSQEHIDLRAFVNRITIEGQSSVVIVLRNYQLEILPLMNSPHV